MGGGGEHERFAESGVASDCRRLPRTRNDATGRTGRAEERRREPAAALHSLGRALRVEQKKRVDCQRENKQEEKKKSRFGKRDTHMREDCNGKAPHHAGRASEAADERKRQRGQTGGRKKKK